MSQWIKIDAAKVNPGTRQNIKGVMVDLYLPPSLIPNQVRGGFDSAIDRFSIEFQYLKEADEAVDNRPSDDGVVTLLIGRLSKRIHKILIDVKKVNASTVGLKVSQQVVKRLEEISSKVESKNYSAALAAINSANDQIFAELKTGTAG